MDKTFFLQVQILHLLKHKPLAVFYFIFTQPQQRFKKLFRIKAFMQRMVFQFSDNYSTTIV